MVGILNRIVTRMVVLAIVMTGITMLVGLGGYYAAMYYRLSNVETHMPPKARAELDRLIQSDQRGSARYYELFDQYNDQGPGITDIGFLATIGFVSILAGGVVATILALRISRPITAVARAAAQVSAGDRSVRVAAAGAAGETADLIVSFNRMAADIQAYERERTVLTAGIAHELRTPLTILKGRLHALSDGVIEPATGEAERLLRQVEQLSRLVEDLRTLAHADAGELALDRRPLELVDVLSGVVADLGSLMAESGVAVVETYQRARVVGDNVRLAQIFTNILTNAVKHSSSGARIDVTLFVDHGYAVVSVMDEGPGFLPEDEHRLFMPFWRAGADKRVGRPGSGIGLALAAKMTEAHGGRIVASNRTDRSGACFAVWIPHGS